MRALMDAAGLKVLELHSHHLGTTVVVVASSAEEYIPGMVGPSFGVVKAFVD